MKKRYLLFTVVASMLLTGCQQRGQKKYDLYENRDIDGINNIYQGHKEEFHLSSWYESEFGQIVVEQDDEGITKVEYTKNTNFEYVNVYTTVMGRLADFYYINIEAKGTPGKGIAMRAFYGEGNLEEKNVLGNDVTFSLDEDYSIHTLKVKGNMQTRLDLLTSVCIYPEIGVSGLDVNGTFFIKDVWFSKVIPNNAKLENPGVDTGDSRINVNGWKTEGWTKYTLFNVGNGYTGVKYLEAAEYAYIEKDLEINEGDNGLRFIFEVKPGSDDHSITSIRFLLRGDVSEHISEGVEYEYDLYYEATVYTYDFTSDKEVQPDENGITTLEFSIENGLKTIGEHHEGGYRLTLMIESHPEDIVKFRRHRDGEMIIRSAEAYQGEFDPSTEVEYTQYGSTVYTISDKEGVEKNITYTNVDGSAYWPRVCRSIVTEHDDTIKLVIRNNDENSVRIGIHAGIFIDDRSDAKNNMFFPLWKNTGFSDQGYFIDGQEVDILGGQQTEITITVDAEFDQESDAIDSLQFVIDSCYGDSTKRSGDIDIVSVTVE